MTHQDVWEFEMRESEPTAWERWIDELEFIFGFVDGDQREDGFSLDGFYQLFEQGYSPDEAVGMIGDVNFE